MIVALIALVLAVGGSAFAAGAIINGKDIMKGSIAGDRLKNDTLGGKQIRESALGTVPSAKRAANASALGGIGASGYVHGGGQIYTTGVTLADGTTNTDLVDVPNVGTIKASCSPTNGLSLLFVNGTGTTVQSSVTGVPPEGTTGPNGPDGENVPPNLSFFQEFIDAANQIHLSLTWPAGAPTHGADLTLGYFHDTTNHDCALNITGLIR